MPKARCVGVAASILARRAPEAFVKASRVVAGERSERMSSVIRERVGDREGERECVRGGNLGMEGESSVAACTSMVVSVIWVCGLGPWMLYDYVVRGPDPREWRGIALARKFNEVVT